MLKIAIVHYHLKPGGVTRVIENAVASLEDYDVNTVALSGATYEGDTLRNTVRIPELAYSTNNSKTDPAHLCTLLKQSAIDSLGTLPDLWHIHNHSLGKNNAFADTVAQLATEGHRLLLQMHDYAEDGRPDNYRRLIKHLGDAKNLYPGGSHVHYATLNNRDLSIFTEAGADTSRLHLLHNSIAVPDNTDTNIPDRITADRLFVYPTRAIRRKNIGELVLWSAISKDTLFAATAAPANPEARPIHDRWKAFAEGHKLPLLLDAVNARKIDFISLIKSSDALITTSVAEGFGLAYLEPWLFQKPLAGRDISDITSDFKSKDIDLSSMYDRLLIPESLTDTQLYKNTLRTKMRAFYETYRRPFKNDYTDIAYSSGMVNGRIDFGRLDERLQEDVINAVLKQKPSANDILPGNLSLPSTNQIANNKKGVFKHFTQEAYGRKLFALYQTVAASETDNSPGIDPEKLLDGFLKPERFNLLRA